MSSVNNAILSVTLTEKKITNGDSLRRLATYQFYDGKTKGMATDTITLIAWGKQVEVLDKLQDGEVVAEGRLGLGEITNSKDKRLQLTVSKIHF